MRTFFAAVALSLSFLLSPFAIPARAAPPSPPIGQPLVPEGYFAAKLAAALHLPTAASDAAAESALAALGIVPSNGWIDQYPVTPAIVSELRQAVSLAASSGKLPMDSGAALQAFETVVAEELGGAMTAGGSGYAEGTPPGAVESGTLDDYYATQGPPVITYYTPPPDYYGLYAWVGYPFWYGGAFFPGYFVLTDFDVIVVRHRHHGRDYDRDGRRRGDRFEVTNHVVDPKTRAVSVLEPDRRRVRPGTRMERTQVVPQVVRAPAAPAKGEPRHDRVFRDDRPAAAPVGGFTRPEPAPRPEGSWRSRVRAEPERTEVRSPRPAGSWSSRVRAEPERAGSFSGRERGGGFASPWTGGRRSGR